MWRIILDITTWFTYSASYVCIRCNLQLISSGTKFVKFMVKYFLKKKVFNIVTENYIIQIGNVMSVIQNSAENGIWKDILWSIIKLMLNLTWPVKKEVTWRQVLVFLNQWIVLSLMHPMMIQKMKLVTMLINHSYVGIVEKSFQLQVRFIQTKDSVSVMFAG